MAWVTRWRLVRLAGVALVILALVGPWVYDQLYIPAEFECQPPTIRLDEDFCGWPIQGLWIITELVTVVSMLVTHTYPGSIGVGDIGGLLLWFAILLVIIAPIISLVLRLKNRQTHRAWVHITVLLLAISITSYLLVNSITFQPMQIWGLWLYVGSVFLLLLEQVVGKINYHWHQSTTG